MEYDYTLKCLDIDLSNQTYTVRQISAQDTARFIGGAGINSWLLYQNMKPAIDPMGSENPLIFGAGPLVGTQFPTAARSTFTSISPLTGIFGDSNGGGVFGVMVKRAGYDHFIIRGKSDNPCYLYIDASGCTFHEADQLWGKDTIETETMLKDRHPGVVVASIGPAGENLVRYAAILTNKNINSFSRAGMGAVMGSKNLKAIAVSGKGNIKTNDNVGCQEIAQTVMQYTQECSLPKLFAKYGTSMFLNMLTSKGLLYARNWRHKVSYEDIESLDIVSYLDATESKNHGCFRCPLKCGKHWKIKAGQFKGEEGYKYEVAYIMAFGLTLGIKDVPTILHLVNKINRLGMDINEFCGTLGMAIDAFKKGLMDQHMTSELKLDWGDAESIEKAMDLVADRSGIGDILAQGTKKAAAKIGNGAEKYALHMKGMHWPAHSSPPFVMAFSLSTRGGDFLKGVPFLLLDPFNKSRCRSLFGATNKTMDIYSHTDKGRAVWWHENYRLLSDCLGICFYLGVTLLPHGYLLPDDLAKAYNAVTGMDVNGKDMLMAAERCNQIQRAINSSLGIDRKQDSFTRRPEPDSWAKGIDLDRPGMLDEYYDYRGLSDHGSLTQKRLESLNLNDAQFESKANELMLSISSATDSRSIEDVIKMCVKMSANNGLRSKIQNRIRRFVMSKMTDSPVAYRKHFRNESRKHGIKNWLKKISPHNAVSELN